MQLTKTLTSVIAATGMVGAIGLAYAQATNDPAQSAPPATQQVPSDPATTPSTTPPATTDTPSTPSAPMSGDTSSSTTLEPQADRN